MHVDGTRSNPLATMVPSGMRTLLPEPTGLPVGGSPRREDDGMSSPPLSDALASLHALETAIREMTPKRRLGRNGGDGNRGKALRPPRSGRADETGAGLLS